ncbi:hypothetical protein [Deinococcus sp. QL22]|uniref:hypothetical protein n=1 Tax=Deinococcus sp. QL22 TaxID=2939437 RepID=UPI002016D774|nr:hypothetical protein [Deinococcus sp. QL22]UQN06192.1 hypothetical protein M1R55_15230 [Deinococcus sp. QL22]
MARFDYLKEANKGNKKAAKRPKQAKSAAITAPVSVVPEPAGPRKGETAERVEAVYVRKETVRAVWREVKRGGGESVSELVEDLLLRWLRERT